MREDLANAFPLIRSLEHSLREAEEEMEKTGSFEAYTELLERFTRSGGYTYMNTIERIARGIGIFHLLDRTLSEVSG